MLTVTSLLGVFLTAGTAQSAEPRFSRAHLSAEGLCFESPIELDWESIARRELKDLPIDAPPPDQLARHMKWGRPTFEYTAALPGSLARLHFYVLSETGATPVKPQRLLGSVRYGTGPSPRPKEIQFYGEVCLPAPGGLSDAGFVAASEHPITWERRTAETVRSGTETLIRLEAGTSHLPPPGAEGPSEIKSLYVLSGSGLKSQYLFVRRVPDPTCIGLCCEFSYDLFRWEPGLPQILWSAYACDV